MAQEVSEQETLHKQRNIMAVMAAISATLVAAGILLGDQAVLGNLIIISLFLTMGPYFFFKYSKYMWTKSLAVTPGKIP